MADSDRQETLKTLKESMFLFYRFKCVLIILNVFQVCVKGSLTDETFSLFCGFSPIVGSSGTNSPVRNSSSLDSLSFDF